MLSIFSRKKNQPFPFDRLITDMHSHMLPGIDDGSPDVETSVQLIQGLINLGYTNFITTPHVMEDLYPNNPDTIGTAFKTLKAGIDDPVLAKKFRFAAEYLLDGNVDMLLEKKRAAVDHKRQISVGGNFICQSSITPSRDIISITDQWIPAGFRTS